MRSAIVLLSGGLDSATVLAMACEQAYTCYALSFRYGQRHVVELAAAEELARRAGVLGHRVVDLDVRWFAGSSLTSPEIAVPKQRPASEGDLPNTYVPARNTVFLAHALAWAEVLGVLDIFVGMNSLDYSGYPDCRPEYVAAFESMARVGTRLRELRIHAPLIHMTKAQIIREGTRLGVDYARTHSCYDPAPDGRACRECDSCVLRAQGFKAAGITDPTRYAA